MVRNVQHLHADVALDQSARGGSTAHIGCGRRSKEHAVRALCRKINPVEYDQLPDTALVGDLYRYAASSINASKRPFANPGNARDATLTRLKTPGVGAVVESIVGFAATVADLDVDVLPRHGDLQVEDLVVEVKSSWVDWMSDTKRARPTHNINVSINQFAEADLFVLATLDYHRPAGELSIDWYVLPSNVFAGYAMAKHRQMARPGSIVVSLDGPDARELLGSYRLDSFSSLVDTLTAYAKA